MAFSCKHTSMKAGDLTVGSEVLAQGNTVQCGRYRRYGAACSVAGTDVMEQRAVWQVPSLWSSVQCGWYRRYGATCSVAGTDVMEQRAVWQVTPYIAAGTDVMERRAVVIFRVDNTSQMILNDL
jgi:hypothetical protein